MPEVAMKVPLSQRINLRILIFAGVVLFLVGYPAYLYLDTQLSGGIHRAGDYTKVDLKAMSTFAFDKVAGRIEDVPKRYRELDGQKVLLEGEMWAPMAAGPTTDQFDLVYSISQCCFTGPPQVQHFVKAKANHGPVPNLHYTRVRVTGTLRVDVQRENGEVTGVYHLDVDKVEPVT
jgi:hypothetical protein